MDIVLKMPRAKIFRQKGMSVVSKVKQRYSIALALEEDGLQDHATEPGSNKGTETEVPFPVLAETGQGYFHGFRAGDEYVEFKS